MQHPFGKTLFEIYITLVFEQLVEFGLVCTMLAFNLSVESWGVRFDVDVINPEVFDMPMKFGLELVAVVCANHAHAKWELGQDVIDEFDRVLLVVD